MINTGTIDEICNIEYGTRVVRKNEKGTEYPVFGGGGESFRINKFNRCDRLIVARFGMSLKCTRYVRGKFFLNDSGLTLSPKNKNLSQPYLDKLILNLNNQIYSLGSGSAQKNLRMDKFRLLKISYPSLLEQQRIVAKLDTAFAEIEKAVSINQQNLKNAKRIYSNGIDEIFRKLSANNEKLGNHSNINHGYTTKASFEKGKYKFLRITDIQENSVNWDKVPFCEIKEEKKGKMLLQDGDIVFARTGATTGKSFLVQNPVNAIFASYLIRVSLNRDVFNPNYVMHFFQSTKYWQQVKAGISGSTQGGFNAAKLSMLEVPIISKDEQHKIVMKLDSLKEQANQLQKIFEEKLALYAALKSSFLSNMLIN